MNVSTTQIKRYDYNTDYTVYNRYDYICAQLTDNTQYQATGHVH